MTKLQSLSLKLTSQADANHFLQLIETLGSLTLLTHLRPHIPFLTDENCSPISQLTNLTKLELPGCLIDLPGVATITRNMTLLQYLDLSTTLVTTGFEEQQILIDILPSSVEEALLSDGDGAVITIYHIKGTGSDDDRQYTVTSEVVNDNYEPVLQQQ